MDEPIMDERMPSPHGTPAGGPAPPDAEWDERYTERGDHMWSGRPNGVLVTEMAGQPPGRALDVGCGEGADAIWLAEQGWQVSGVDVSRVALARAREAAQAARVTVEWIRADVSSQGVGGGAYDLVSVQYPALPKTPDNGVIRSLIDAVARGGTLLVAGHDLADNDHARDHGFDPADYVQPSDIAAVVDDSWDIEVEETRPRATPPPDASYPHVADVVLRARRRA